MSRPRRKCVHWAALAAAVSACSGGTSPLDILDGATEALQLRAASTEMRVADVLQQGLPATFTNHATASVRLLGSGCGAHGARVDRQMGFTWVPLEEPVILTVVPCLPPPPGDYTVAVGDSTPITASVSAADVTPGRYRMRLSTDQGEAVSKAFVLH